MSSIIVYPRSNTVEKAEKANSEKNLSSRSSGLVRNRIVEGLALSVSDETLNYLKVVGSSSVKSQTLIDSTNIFVLNGSRYEYLTAVSQVRRINDAGNYVGDSIPVESNKVTIEGSTYEIITKSAGNIIIGTGVCFIAGYRVEVTTPTPTHMSNTALSGSGGIYLHLVKNPVLKNVEDLELLTEAELKAESDYAANSYYGDYILIGNYNGTSVSSAPQIVKSALRAQDIYVQGSSDEMLDGDSHKYSYLEPNGKTLDELLATMIISDGQF